MGYFFSFLGVWENSNGRWDTNQPQQQLSNFSPSCLDAVQVSMYLYIINVSLFFMYGCSCIDIVPRSLLGVLQARPGRRSC